MTVPRLEAVPLTPVADSSKLLLVVGPSIGTSVEMLWSACAARLTERFAVLGWDLPGHGRSPAVTERFSMADLAAAVLALVRDAQAARGESSPPFHYVGDSLGGAVGLQLLLDAPERISAATLIATGLRIGVPEAWRERAGLVRRSGTEALVESAPSRWFGPGFLARNPTAAAALLAALAGTDAESYALACEALAGFDVRTRLGGIQVPVRAVAGRDDQVTPVADLAAISGAVLAGSLTVLDGCADLPPVEVDLARSVLDELEPDQDQQEQKRERA